MTTNQIRPTPTRRMTMGRLYDRATPAQKREAQLQEERRVEAAMRRIDRTYQQAQAKKAQRATTRGDK